MDKASRDHREFLIEELKDPEFAVAYLNEHVDYSGPNARELLLNAFKAVLEARGFTHMSKKTGISRRALYKAFASNGNPTLETLQTLLECIGISMQFSVAAKTKRKTKRSAAPRRN